MGGTWQKRELWTIKCNTDCRMRRMEDEESTCPKNNSMESRGMESEAWEWGAEHGYSMTVWKPEHAESSTWVWTEDMAKVRQKNGELDMRHAE